MANQAHVERLKQSVAGWNAWREKHPEILPDLSHADLSHTNLRGVNLSDANLISANLNSADLTKANLNRARLVNTNFNDANLSGANLEYANLSRANLSRADLSYASFIAAHLESANLRHAKLNFTDLVGADLSDARLDGAHFVATKLLHTTIAWVNLRTVEGLDTVIHAGPSIVDVNSVQLPEGETRQHFLRGAGFSDAFIDYLPSLLTAAIQYASCFISYAHRDEALARCLYKDLQEKGVRCWFAPEDMKIGTKIRSRIDEAIHQQDKLLLLLSEHSIVSTWVESEVEAALEKEDRQRREVLFPLCLDDAVMQTSQAWAATLRRTRHIGDFTNWADPQAYQRAFDRLLRDLKKANQEEIEDRGN